MIPRFYMPYELHWSVGYCLGKMRALIFMIFPFAIFLLPAVSSQEQQWSLHMAPVFIFTPFSDAIATGTLFSLKWVQCHDTMRKEMQDLKKIWGNQDKISHDFRNSVKLMREVSQVPSHIPKQFIWQIKPCDHGYKCFGIHPQMAEKQPHKVRTLSLYHHLVLT